jgi:hypothetical protein
MLIAAPLLVGGLFLFFADGLIVARFSAARRLLQVLTQAGLNGKPTFPLVVHLPYTSVSNVGPRANDLCEKLAQSAQNRWRRLDGHEKIVSLIEGKIFVNGEMQDAA